MLGVGVPFTVIDSLDTMLVMGLDEMFQRNLKYLKTSFHWNFVRFLCDQSVVISFLIL
jgi:hypothetical protein